MTLAEFVERKHVVAGTLALTNQLLEKELRRHGARLKVGVDVPYLLAVPSLVANSDYIAAIPDELAALFARLAHVDVFPLPIELPDLTVQQFWHARPPQRRRASLVPPAGGADAGAGRRGAGAVSRRRHGWQHPRMIEHGFATISTQTDRRALPRLPPCRLASTSRPPCPACPAIGAPSSQGASWNKQTKGSIAAPRGGRGIRERRDGSDAARCVSRWAAADWPRHPAGSPRPD